MATDHRIVWWILFFDQPRKIKATSSLIARLPFWRLNIKRGCLKPLEKWGSSSKAFKGPLLTIKLWKLWKRQLIRILCQCFQNPLFGGQEHLTHPSSNGSKDCKLVKTQTYRNRLIIPKNKLPGWIKTAQINHQKNIQPKKKLRSTKEII